MATQEFVVPRSMPMTFAMYIHPLLAIFWTRARLGTRLRSQFESSLATASGFRAYIGMGQGRCKRSSGKSCGKFRAMFWQAQG
jgi:hypothetical protein